MHDRPQLLRRMPIGPGGRPIGGLRPLVALAALLAAVPGVILMFSDRAPGLLDRVVDRIQRLDSRPRELVAAAGIEDPALIVHIVVWAVAGFLIVLMAWSWPSLLAGLALAFVAGVGVEAAQERYTGTRAAQWIDVVGNTIGLVAGAAAGLLVWVVVLLALRLTEARRSAAPAPTADLIVGPGGLAR